MDENKNLTLVIDLDTSKAEKKVDKLKEMMESVKVNADKSSNASSKKDNTSSNIANASKEAKKTKSEFDGIKSLISEINGILGIKITRSIGSILNRITKIKNLVNKIKAKNATNISNIANKLKSVSKTSNEADDLANNMQKVKEETKDAASYASELQKQILAAAKASTDFEFDEDYDDGDIDIDEYNAMQEALSESSDEIKSIADNADKVSDGVSAATGGMGKLNSAASTGAVAMSKVASGASSAGEATLGAAKAASGSLAAALLAVAAIIGKLVFDIGVFVLKFKTAKRIVELTGKALEGLAQFAKNVVEAVQAIIRKIGQLISDLKSKIISLENYISKMIDISLSGGDYVENVNLIENVFGKASDKIVGSLEEIRKEFGVDTVTASKYLGSLGLKMREMTDDEDELADKSIELVKRIADVASQANYSFADVADNFSSGIVGMTRPLDKYGINIRAVAIGQEELAKELGKTYSKMSQAEKMQARYNKILKDSAVAAGDFARTANSWNNVLKTIQNQLKELKTLIGQGLIVVFSKVAIAVRDLLDKLINKVKIIVIALAEVFNFDLSSIKGNVKDSTEGVNDLTDGVEDLTKKVNDKKLVAGFDNLYSLTREASDSMSDLSSASNLDFGSLLGNNKKEKTSLFELTPEEEQNLKKVEEAITKIKEALQYIKENIVDPMLKMLGTFFEEHITPNLQKIQEAIAPELEEQVGHILSIFDSILGIMGNIIDIGTDLFVGLNIPERITDALAWIDEVMGNIDEWVNNIIDDWDEDERAGALEILNNLLDIGWQLIKDFLTGLGKFFDPVVEGVSTLLQKLSTDDNFKDSINGLKDSAKNLGDKWKDLCETAGNYIGDWLKSDDAVDFMTRAVDTLSGALNGLGTVLSIIQEWIPKVIEAYNKLPKGMKDLLMDVIAFIIGKKLGGDGVLGVAAGVTAVVAERNIKNEMKKSRKDSVDAISSPTLIDSKSTGNGSYGSAGGRGYSGGGGTNITINDTKIYNPGVVNSGGSGKPNASASSSKAANTAATRARLGQ